MARFCQGMSLGKLVEPVECMMICERVARLCCQQTAGAPLLSSPPHGGKGGTLTAGLLQITDGRQCICERASLFGKMPKKGRKGTDSGTLGLKSARALYCCWSWSAMLSSAPASSEKLWGVRC